MKVADQRVCQRHCLVLLAPTAPAAPAAVAVAALVLVPLVVVGTLGLAPLVAASLRTGLCTSLRTSLSTSLRAGSLAVTSSRNTGSALRSSGRTSGGNAGGVTRVCGASCSGAILGGGLLRRGGTCRSSAGAVEFALDEGEGVLAVLFAVALVDVSIAAVTAVWVSAVAVGLHLGAGLLEIVSMDVLVRV